MKTASFQHKQLWFFFTQDLGVFQAILTAVTCLYPLLLLAASGHNFGQGLPQKVLEECALVLYSVDRVV